MAADVIVLVVVEYEAACCVLQKKIWLILHQLVVAAVHCGVPVAFFFLGTRPIASGWSFVHIRPL
jgi:hypothetical protein